MLFKAPVLILMQSGVNFLPLTPPWLLIEELGSAPFTGGALDLASSSARWASSLSLISSSVSSTKQVTSLTFYSMVSLSVQIENELLRPIYTEGDFS